MGAAGCCYFVLSNLRGGWKVEPGYLAADDGWASLQPDAPQLSSDGAQAQQLGFLQLFWFAPPPDGSGGCMRRLRTHGGGTVCVPSEVKASRHCGFVSCHSQKVFYEGLMLVWFSETSVTELVF